MKKRKCATKNCRRKPQGNRKHCSTCRVRRHRKKHPVKYAYQTNKDNAKRRKKPHTITFEYFKEFCEETDYMAGKGRTKKKLQY